MKVVIILYIQEAIVHFDGKYFPQIACQDNYSTKRATDYSLSMQHLTVYEKKTIVRCQELFILLATPSKVIT